MKMMRMLSTGATTALIVAWGAASASAQSDGSLRGKIAGYECGDNCYLTIVDEFGGKHDGLCVADACRPWNQATQMPKRLIGKTVVAHIAMGVQLDGSGSVVGRAMAFRTLRFP